MRRTRIVLLAISALLVIAGVTVALAGGSEATVIGGFLIGVAAILLIGRVFYEIGISEDRERARGRS
jgi:amino acid transporter